MNDPGLDEPIGETSDHVESDRKVALETDIEEDRAFLDPRFFFSLSSSSSSSSYSLAIPRNACAETVSFFLQSLVVRIYCFSSARRTF